MFGGDNLPNTPKQVGSLSSLQKNCHRFRCSPFSLAPGFSQVIDGVPPVRTVLTVCLFPSFPCSGVGMHTGMRRISDSRSWRFFLGKVRDLMEMCRMQENINMDEQDTQDKKLSFILCILFIHVSPPALPVCIPTPEHGNEGKAQKGDRPVYARGLASLASVPLFGPAFGFSPVPTPPNKFEGATRVDAWSFDPKDSSREQDTS